MNYDDNDNSIDIYNGEENAPFNPTTILGCEYRHDVFIVDPPALAPTSDNHGMNLRYQQAASKCSHLQTALTEWMLLKNLPRDWKPIIYQSERYYKEVKRRVEEAEALCASTNELIDELDEVSEKLDAVNFRKMQRSFTNVRKVLLEETEKNISTINEFATDVMPRHQHVVKDYFKDMYFSQDWNTITCFTPSQEHIDKFNRFTEQMEDFEIDLECSNESAVALQSNARLLRRIHGGLKYFATRLLLPSTRHPNETISPSTMVTPEKQQRHESKAITRRTRHQSTFYHYR